MNPIRQSVPDDDPRPGPALSNRTRRLVKPFSNQYFPSKGRKVVDEVAVIVGLVFAVIFFFVAMIIVDSHSIWDIIYWLRLIYTAIFLVLWLLLPAAFVSGMLYLFSKIFK